MKLKESLSFGCFLSPHLIFSSYPSLYLSIPSSEIKQCLQEHSSDLFQSIQSHLNFPILLLI